MHKILDIQKSNFNLNIYNLHLVCWYFFENSLADVSIENLGYKIIDALEKTSLDALKKGIEDKERNKLERLERLSMRAFWFIYLYLFVWGKALNW